MCPAPPLFQLMFVYPRSASVTQDSGEWVTERASEPPDLSGNSSKYDTNLSVSQWPLNKRHRHQRQQTLGITHMVSLKNSAHKKNIT